MAHTVSYQRAHIRDIHTLGQLGAVGTGCDTLSPLRSFACQAALVNLKIEGSDQADVSRDAVACGEGDEVIRNKLVSEQVNLLSVAMMWQWWGASLLSASSDWSERCSCTKSMETVGMKVCIKE
jgi:hypothetical protein